MPAGLRTLNCFVCLFFLWAGALPALAATWQEYRDAGLLAFENADYPESAEHFEMALIGAHEAQASHQELGVILERLTTAYFATRWFRSAQAAIVQWDGILKTSAGEPWVYQQRADRDRLALLVSEVLGDTEPEPTSPLSAPPYEAAEETPEELDEAPPLESDVDVAFEPEVDISFAPDVDLPISLAADQPFEAVKETSAARPATSGYAIHLVSLKTQDAADHSWAELKESFPDLLSDKDLEVRPIDLVEQGTFYRVHAFPFADAVEAKAACEKFRLLQQYCAVVTLD